MRHMDGEYITEVRQRVCSVYTNGVRTRQLAARKEWEEARLLQRPPPKTSADSEDIDHAMDFQFITSREDKGIPVKTLMSGRRAIEGMLMSPKGKVFEKYPHDTIEVRIKVGGSVLRLCRMARAFLGFRFAILRLHSGAPGTKE